MVHLADIDTQLAVIECDARLPRYADVTFAPDGHVANVRPAEEREAAEECLNRSLLPLRVAPFEGKPRTFRYVLALRAAPETIRAIDGARPPPGYHVEEHRREALLWAGVPLGALGIYCLADAVVRKERRTWFDSPGLEGVLGGVALAAGIGLTIGGFTTRPVWVRDGQGVAYALTVSGGF
jgi:hypothetical protein